MYPCGSGLCILCADALLDVTLDFSFTGFARLFLNEGFVNLPILGGNVIKKKKKENTTKCIVIVIDVAIAMFLVSCMK